MKQAPLHQMIVVPIFLAFLIVEGAWCQAQEYPYLKSQGRFDFAQTYLGLDFMKFGFIETAYLTKEDQQQQIKSQLPITPRLTIGGLHFWGHADFYVTFPINSSVNSNDLKIRFSNGVETGFRIYPFRLEPMRISPFWGLAWNVMTYEQGVSSSNKGPRLTHSLTSQNVGIVWTTQIGLFELGYQFYPANSRKFRYPISRTQTTQLVAPSSSFWGGYKWVFDTTDTPRSTKNSSSGNAFTLGVGPSSAFTLGKSSYLEEERPFLNPYPVASIFLDYSLGYYFAQTDMAFNLSYRSIPMDQTAYGIKYQAKRDVISLEWIKFIWDYHGFVPLIGPTWNQEMLSFREKDHGQTTINTHKTVSTLGLIFGWDIRPTNNNFLILRTNLRYVPAIDLELPSGRKVSFQQWEFNFIQVVLHFR